MANVLILDHHTGFLLWLGTTLSNAGHVALPAPSISDAKILMKELEFTPDVLVVDSAVRGALKFVSASRQLNRRLRVLAISDPSTSTRIQFDAALPKPSAGDADMQAVWLDWIESLSRRTWHRDGPTIILD